MKQRLIGALVLLCGGVILWSLLFTGPAVSKLDRHSQIPAAPQSQPLIELEPKRPQGIVPADTELVAPQPMPRIDDESAAEPFAERKAASEPAPPKLAPKPAPKQEVTPVDKPMAKPVAAPSTQKPVLDQRGLPLAWVVQVGVFGNAENASVLKKSLLAEGYKAFIDTVNRDSKQLHRVLVGPVVDEATATTQQGAINQRFNVKSIVNRFEP